MSRNRFAANDFPSAVLYPKTANSKLAPVELVANTTQRLRPVPVAPFCSSTYVSIKATCPDSCAFKSAGCYVTSGFYRRTSDALDQHSLGMTPHDVLREERAAIEMYISTVGEIPQDGGRHANAGRDLRLHVGGDVGTIWGAYEIAKAATAWRRAKGGAVWTYTHLWREVPRAAFGRDISVLASTESAEDAASALARGYAPAVVVSAFRSRSVYDLGEGVKVLPCPAETSDRNCVSCRACFDSDSLIKRRMAIGFQAHGVHAGKVRRRLKVLSGDQLQLGL